jgi:hypothetical protein
MDESLVPFQNLNKSKILVTRIQQLLHLTEHVRDSLLKYVSNRRVKSLWGHNAACLGESQEKFRRNASPLSSALNMKVTYSSETYVYFTGLHVIISQKTEELFINTALRTSNRMFFTKVKR